MWRITVRARPQDRAPRWQATFSKHTPAEIVGAFVKALADDRHVAPEEILAEPTASPTTAWRPLLSAGWTTRDVTAVVAYDPDGTNYIIHTRGPGPFPGQIPTGALRVESPDGKAALTHNPRPDEAFDPGLGPWMVEVSWGQDWDDEWTAILSADTPIRYLHKLTSAVVAPAPVTRTGEDLTEAIRTAAHVRTATPSTPHNSSSRPGNGARYDAHHQHQGHLRSRRD